MKLDKTGGNENRREGGQGYEKSRDQGEIFVAMKSIWKCDLGVFTIRQPQCPGLVKAGSEDWVSGAESTGIKLQQRVTLKDWVLILEQE